MKKVWIGITIVCLLILSAVGLSQRGVEREVDSYHITPIATQKILKAHRHLAKIEALKPIGRTKDAGVIFNKHFGLSNGTPAHDPLWWSNMMSKKEERAEIDENWLTDPAQLVKKDGTPKYDDEILSRLMIYDYWEPASSGALGEYLMKPSRSAVAFGVTLEMMGLVSLAKIRLSRGLREANLEPALRETRHLARLCLGHDSLLDSAIGIAILSLEEKALNQAGILGIDTSFWEPLRNEDIELARKLLMTSIQLYDPSSNHTSRPFIEQEEVFERCAILAEGGYMVHILRSTELKEKKLWALEANLLTPIQHFEHDWEASGCSLPRLKQDWNNLNAEEMFGVDARMLRIPYARTFILAELFQIGMVVDPLDNDPLDGLDKKAGL